MPLYKRALNFDPKNLPNMTFDECNELLLCFRYLRFRDDGTIASEIIDSHIEEIRNRLVELNAESANFQHNL